MCIHTVLRTYLATSASRSFSQVASVPGGGGMGGGDRLGSGHPQKTIQSPEKTIQTHKC